jgi:aryl-alcohol dehydrogenase-like predicted oxidoreductase
MRLSPICLGTMTFGTEWGFGSDLEESQRILDLYTDRGGNFLDAANIDTGGSSDSYSHRHTD